MSDPAPCEPEPEPEWPLDADRARSILEQRNEGRRNHRSRVARVLVATCAALCFVVVISLVLWVLMRDESPSDVRRREDCAQMCRATDSTADTWTSSYGCLCADGTHFPARGSL